MLLNIVLVTIFVRSLLCACSFLMWCFVFQSWLSMVTHVTFHITFQGTMKQLPMCDLFLFLFFSMLISFFVVVTVLCFSNYTWVCVC